MTTTLDVASDSTNSLGRAISKVINCKDIQIHLRRATDGNVSVFGHKGMYYVPDISASNNNCTFGPISDMNYRTADISPGTGARALYASSR